MKTHFLLISLIIYNMTLFGQSFSYKSLSSQQKQIDYSSLEKIKNERFSDAVSVVKYLPKGYSQLGDVDYTEFLQRAIDENSAIIMPDFAVKINDKGLSLKSNLKILFLKKSGIILAGSRRSQYAVFRIDRLTNVEIYYPYIVGDRKVHLGNSGQWGMGIWINNSNNVSVIYPKIINCWGDGIYLGNEKGSRNNENIVISNGILDNNRRNGISIVAGNNVLVERMLISNTNGHNPKSGIDIEPNSNDDYIGDIRINNVTTFNNEMNGIVISVGNLAGPMVKNMNISIDNHKDTYSYLGIGLIPTRQNAKANTRNIKGTITIKNSYYLNNGYASLMNYKGKLHGINLILDNINMKRKSKNQVNQIKTGEFISNFKNGSQFKIQ